jgi:hypothetical protein
LLSTAARDILAPVNFPSNLLGLGVALGIGLLIGAERERRKGLGPLRSAAGVRTFALASLGGALCLILGGELLLVAAVLGAFAFSAISYARSRAADPGLTSEFALVVAVLLGALAIRQPALAAGLGVVTTVLLASRDLLHRWLRDLLTEQEAHDAVLFLAAALIILPLTPDRTIGPMGIFEPRKLWELVVLVLAIAGTGHIATRAFGWRYGLPLAGLLGGFVSATATIGSMGASARSDPKLLRPALAGALFANIATVLQMAILLFIISRPLLSRLAWPLVFAAFAALACALAYGLLNSPFFRVTTGTVFWSRLSTEISSGFRIAHHGGGFPCGSHKSALRCNRPSPRNGVYRLCRHPLRRHLDRQPGRSVQAGCRRCRHADPGRAHRQYCRENHRLVFPRRQTVRLEALSRLVDLRAGSLGSSPCQTPSAF